MFCSKADKLCNIIDKLKNAHNLAAHIYENGPQTLTDVISEVEKLHATQQLTTTLIPPPQ